MQQDEIPEDVAHGDRLSVEEGDGSIEVVDGELAHSFEGVAMDASEGRRQLFDGSRPLDSRRSHVAGETSPFDGEGTIGFRLGEVPGHLADGATVRVGAEIVLVPW